MKRLLEDENFVTLLRAESIKDTPSHLAERIGQKGFSVTLPANVGFELKTVVVHITSITARGALTAEVRKSRKYRQITASMAHVGLVEPLVVTPVGDGLTVRVDCDIGGRRNLVRGVGFGAKVMCD